MLIDYKLIGNSKIFHLPEIENSISLSEISLRAKELSESYERTLSRSCILMQAMKDIFATDIFSDHDEFFQKIIIYSLTIEKLQQDYQNIEYIVIHDTSSKIENYLNRKYNTNILKNNKLDKFASLQIRTSDAIGDVRNKNNLKSYIEAIMLMLRKRVSLVASLVKLKHSRSILLHHSIRFDDLISGLNQLNLGQIDTVSYLPIKPSLSDFYIIVFTALLTLISILLTFTLLPIARFTTYPVLAEQFHRECRGSLRYTQHVESSVFYIILFFIMFKIKNINEVFLYSHLTPLMRCFIRCAKLRKNKINYIRYNHLYFTTELHALYYSRFYVLSNQEANIARQIGINSALVLESKFRYPNLASTTKKEILYIDEANIIDTTHPLLRAAIYTDLARLATTFNIKVTVRPHPTDKTAHLRCQNVLDIAHNSALRKSSIIIGRTSTLLLKLASLGKTVIVYDPSCSLWFKSQSKLELEEDIVFLSNYTELETRLKIHGL